MANWVLSISPFSAIESSRKMWENEPAVSSGKSDCGRHCRRKLERPEATVIALPSSSVFEHHLGAVGELADDVVEQMRRNRRGAAAARPWRASPR